MSTSDQNNSALDDEVSDETSQEAEQESDNADTLVDAKDDRKTILIFGISSFVGSNLAQFFKEDFRVVGTYHGNPVKVPGILSIPCDVHEKAEVQLALFAFRPDISIYCVGIASVFDCYKSQQKAEALNTSGLFNVAEMCQRYKSQICYISSSYVFGGDDKPYIEMDIPDANSTLGKTQAAAEFYIQKTSLNYIIFRCSRLYGRSIHPIRKNFLEVLQKRLRQGQNFICDNTVVNGFLDIAYLAMVLKICFDKNVMNRLFQLSSSDALSYYDFSKQYCEVFGDNSELVVKGKWPFPVLSAGAGGAISGDDLFYKMDIGNLEGFLNIKMPTIKESLAYSYRRFGGKVEEDKSSKKGEGITFI
ncbi:MAG: sugar nucleotide-binding protein [Halobacteriovoraceae bacterium]|jgi:dTDP-4-dehydrorhamnose reductase|nr:sugar nucleotide-binding protein [Halobacteriovoraceae bacterium]MBT5094380.1 sugar nucleotide-binding protein [Halobacteriovoraceae bacterium]